MAVGLGPGRRGWRRLQALGRSACCAAAALLLWVGLCGAASARDVTPADLQGQMDRLVGEIRKYQDPDGSWTGSPRFRRGQWPVGQTALAVLALASANVPADDPLMKKGLQYLLGNTTDKVYEASLKAMALEMVDRRRYHDQIKAVAELLIRAQCDSGGWSYGADGRGSTDADNSNSQFAVLGLRSAARSGVAIPDSVWKGVWQYFSRGQNEDGGWGYRLADKRSYASMTCAGSASLYIAALWLHVSRGQCGKYIDDKRIKAGLGWLADNFSVTENTNFNRYKFYYLYALERVCVISARRYLGRRDWYVEGVTHLVRDPSGMEPRKGDTSEPPLIRACFALLFLSKGNAPVLIQKAQWTGSWNPHRYDAKFLVDYLRDQFGQQLAWQITPMEAPLDHLQASPILYISGRGEFRLNETQLARLKQYMDGGGFVLVEANEGDRQFDRSFRSLLSQHFAGAELAPLPKKHPLYTCHFDLPVEDRVPLEAIAGPCWISLLYCPGGLSCPWDVAQFSDPNFKLGANIVAYVTGLEPLKGRLEAQTAPAPEQEQPAELRGAFVVGQLVHGGNWKPHKRAWNRILAAAHRHAGLSLFSAPISVDPKRDSLFKAHLLNITGTREFKLSPGSVTKLRQYVERGGFVFAEAACGSRQFDESFRALMKEAFPDHPLEEVPLGHPLFELGRPLGEVSYSRAVRENQGLRPPLLEQIELEGRAVVVYTSYDLSSAIAGHPCFTCAAVLEPSASELLLKVILYALEI